MVRLITEIVILVTALIGFYKVARYSRPPTQPSSPQVAKGPPSGKRLLSHFEPALSFLGIYAGILVPVVFMLVYMWLVGGSSSLLAHLSEPAKETPVTLPQAGSGSGPIYWAWQTARFVRAPGDRNLLLASVVQAAIRQNQFAVALEAARAMAYPADRDDNLGHVATSAASSGDTTVAAAAVQAISAPHKQGDTARTVVQLLLQRNSTPAEATSPKAPRP